MTQRGAITGRISLGLISGHQSLDVRLAVVAAELVLPGLPLIPDMVIGGQNRARRNELVLLLDEWEQISRTPVRTEVKAQADPECRCARGGAAPETVDITCRAR